MKSRNFLIKTESVREFFINSLLDLDRQTRVVDDNIYSLFKDSILIKKNVLVSDGDVVVFELADSTIGARYPIKNTYTYKASRYDDISLNLELTDFTVEPINKNDKNRI